MNSFAPHVFAIMLVNNKRSGGGKGFNLSVSVFSATDGEDTPLRSTCIRVGTINGRIYSRSPLNGGYLVEQTSQLSGAPHHVP